MSETYHSAFGQQIFTDVSASGNSSGRDRFEMLDATQFYHSDREYQAPGTLRLSGQDSNYANGHPFAYASHSGPPSLPSKPTFLAAFFPCVRTPLDHFLLPGSSHYLRSLLLVCYPIPLGCRFCMASFPRQARNVT